MKFLVRLSQMLFLGHAIVDVDVIPGEAEVFLFDLHNTIGVDEDLHPRTLYGR